MFSKILVPIDGSDMAWRALEDAVVLGEKFSSSITIIHVVQPYNTIPSIDGSPIFIPRDVEEIQRSGDVLLKHAAEKMVGYPYPLDTHIEYGYPAERILHLIKEQGFDAVVIGYQGLSAFAEFLLGSVAMNVAQHSPVPVLIVK